MENISQLLEKVKDLPTSPQLLPKLLDVMRNENSSLADIGDLIAFDPALTARLLKYCNSALFGGAEPLTNVPDAVGRVGLSVIHQLVTTACGSAAFVLPADCGIDAGELWKHSLLTAFGAKFVAEATDADSNMLFTAGLLHDVGRVVFAKVKGAEYGQLLQRAHAETLSVSELEKAAYGFTHADVSAALLHGWNMPSPLRNAVHYHHRPQDAGDSSSAAACVCLGNVLAHGATSSAYSAEISAAMKLLKIEPSNLTYYAELMAENWPFVNALLQAEV